MTKLLSLAFFVLCVSGCGTTVRLGSRTATRTGIFHTSYEEAKTRLAQVRPGVKLDVGMGVRESEVTAGEERVLSILEGGSDWHKFPHRTTIRVIRIDDTSCQVDLHSWASNLVFPSHRMWLKEWNRWREVKRILKQT